MSKPFTITLHFGNQNTVDYILRTCRRKGTDLETYIIDNFEWDTQLDCISYDAKQLTVGMCKDCEFDDRCPDVKRRKAKP